MQTSEATGPSDVTPQQKTMDVGITAKPPQSEFEDIRRVMKCVYQQYYAMDRSQRLRDNFISAPSSSPRHCRVMNKIDKFFICESQFGIGIDPDIINHLADTNSKDLRQASRLDKIRINLMNLEIIRHEIEYDLKRMKTAMFPVRGELKKMVCNVCMSYISPSIQLSFGDCGHVVCKDCTRQIIDSPYVRSTCGNCRNELTANTLISAFFKFNDFKEPICRFCFSAFKETDDPIKMIDCGHVYHKSCMFYNANCCMECGFEVIDVNLPTPSLELN